jgi:hypothetical protein
VTFQLRVSFAAQSNLKEKAKELGQDVAEQSTLSAMKGVVSSMHLHETWDVLDAFKKMVEEDRSTARYE